MKNKLVFGFLISILYFAYGLHNGVGKLPPMGFNTWNCFAGDIEQEKIKKTADLMVELGLRDLGYTYLNIDDGWAESRDQDGHIVVNERLFPLGMLAIGDYIHSKGLKFGIYTCCGTKTCMGLPGSYGFENQDAKTYAEWTVDFLKEDWCNTKDWKPESLYPIMRDALNATGREIFFSMCEWGVDLDPTKQPLWTVNVGNAWRTTGDIKDNWASMLNNLDLNDRFWESSGPYQHNDPDMLEVGNGGMTIEEYRSHFSLWAIVKSPLLIGCDLSTLSSPSGKEYLDILTNEEIIAVNQDILAVQGHKVLYLEGDDTKSRELKVMDCKNNINQRWIFNESSAGIHGDSNLCLDVYMCQTKDQSNVQSFECHETDAHEMCKSRNQQWAIQDNHLISLNDRRCLQHDPISNGLETYKCQKDNVLQHFEFLNESIVTSNSRCISMITPYEIWAGPLSSGYVLCLFNRNHVDHVMTVDFQDVDPTWTSFNVRDLWSHIDLGHMSQYSALVPSHGVIVLKLT